MFEQDKTRNFINVKKEQVITLLNSTIRPHVAMGGLPSEPTDAYACTVKQGNLYETLIFLHLTKSHNGYVYKWEDGPQARENAKGVEREALKFLEAMGFQMDSYHFRKKSAEEQQRIMESLPCFLPSLDHLKESAAESEELNEELDEVLAEEADDDMVADIDEVMIESVEGVEEEAIAEAVPDAAEAVEAVEESQDSVFAEAIPEGSEAEKIEAAADNFELASEPLPEEAAAAVEEAPSSDFFEDDAPEPSVAVTAEEAPLAIEEEATAVAEPETLLAEPMVELEEEEAISVEVTPDEPTGEFEEDLEVGTAAAPETVSITETQPEPEFEAAVEESFEEPEQPLPTQILVSQPEPIAPQASPAPRVSASPKEETRVDIPAQTPEDTEPLARFLASM